MKPRLLVVDTNVVVSGLLTADADSPPAVVLDAMLAGRISFLLSVDLLAEYRSVLLRLEIATRHGLSPQEVDVVLERLAVNAVVREPVSAPEAPPDPGDALLWELLAAAAGAILVTGDQSLLDAPPRFASALSPAALVELLEL